MGSVMWGAPWGGVALALAASSPHFGPACPSAGYGWPHPGSRLTAPVGSVACADATPTRRSTPVSSPRASAWPSPRCRARRSAASTSARPRTCSRSPTRASREALRWGLIPPWARKLRAGPGADQRPLGDARGKRLFAPLVADAGAPLPRRRRRLVRVAAARAPRRATRIPFRYTVDGGEQFAFAGLWDSRPRRRRADRVGDDPHHAGERGLRRRCTTGCRACSRRRRRRRRGCRRDVDADAALELLAPLADARTAAAPANPAVNRAGVEGPELIVPAGARRAGAAAARLALVAHPGGEQAAVVRDEAARARAAGTRA